VGSCDHVFVSTGSSVNFDLVLFFQYYDLFL
jgi:hypothetical protein